MFLVGSNGFWISFLLPGRLFVFGNMVNHNNPISNTILITLIALIQSDFLTQVGYKRMDVFTTARGAKIPLQFHKVFHTIFPALQCFNLTSYVKGDKRFEYLGTYWKTIGGHKIEYCKALVDVGTFDKRRILDDFRGYGACIRRGR